MERDKDFRAFVLASWARLVRTAILLGCRPADAEDIVQTTLLRAYVSWDKVSRAHSQEAYVYRMLVNAQVSASRRRWRAELPTADLPEHVDSRDPISELELADAVVKALTRLTANHRAVLVLRYYADLSEAQIAEALGIPHGTVKSRVARAQALLLADSALSQIKDGGA